MKNLKENSETALMTVFSLEHILLFSVAGIQIYLNKEPKWVETFRARKSYRESKIILAKNANK